VLQSDTVHYCAPGEAHQYALAFADGGEVATTAERSANGARTPEGLEGAEGAELSAVAAAVAARAVAASQRRPDPTVAAKVPRPGGGARLAWASSGERVVTPPQGLIFVLRDGVIYAAEKTTQAPR
jgi:diaminopimelate epimerase